MKSNAENFIEACEIYSDSLFRYSYFKVSDREKAKDLVQETFMRAWNHIANGGEVSSFKSFFYRILGNLIIDEYRKKKPVSLESLTDFGFDVSVNENEKLVDQIDGRIAMEVLRKIPEKYREIIFMKYVEGYTNKEIAEILQETENSISVKLHRGIKKLKEIFKEV